MTMGAEHRWRGDELRFLANSHELEISASRLDGSAGPWTPIWVVVADSDVFVRTWQRRRTGWYGQALASGSARIRIADSPVDVIVTVAGDATVTAVDAAYRAKYGHSGAQSMVSAEAAASTLLLTRAG